MSDMNLNTWEGFWKEAEIVGFGIALHEKLFQMKCDASLRCIDRECERRIKQLRAAEKEENLSGVDAVKEEEKKAEEEKPEEKCEIKKATETELHVTPPQEPIDNSDLTINIDKAKAALPEVDPREVKLTIISMLYAAMIIDSETVYRNLDPNGPEDIEFVNSILKAWTGFVLNPSYKTLPVKDLYKNVKDFQSIVSYESTYEQFAEDMILQTIVEKTRNILIEIDRQKKIDEGEADPDPIVPIMFVNKNMDMQAHRGLNKNEVKAMENKLGDLLTPYKYQFNKIGQLVELVIHNDDRMDSYLIDNGDLFGIGTAMLVNIGSYLFPISVDNDKDIVSAFLQNPKYVPNSAEIIRIQSRLFWDNRVYINFDMSNISQVQSKTDHEQYSEFFNKLSSICGLNWGAPNRPVMPRFRIKSFKSVDDFYLVSDEKVKVPTLVGFNQIIAPIIIQVKDNKVMITWKVEDKEFKAVQIIGPEKEEKKVEVVKGNPALKKV